MPLDTLGPFVSSLLDTRRVRLRRSVAAPIATLSAAAVVSQESAGATHGKGGKAEKAAAAAKDKEKDDGACLLASVCVSQCE